jgi:YD repeat-containing protein
VKKSLALIFVILLLFKLGVNKVFAGLQSVAQSSQPIDLRDRFETDLFTGSGVYSYAIKVPKGTNDLMPEISLSYSSLGARDLIQSVGSGWRLSHDYIERDVNYSPANLTDDKFRLHFKGGVYELVFVFPENRYHTKTESFLNITKISGGENGLGEYWQVVEKNGTKYRFGYKNDSELLCVGRNYINRWSLDQAEDTHGNKMFYGYTEASGLSYLSKIEYNNEKGRVIDFQYEPNPFQKQLYIQGCSTAEVNRLKNAQVKTNGGLVRQYDLNYGPNGGTAQILQSITEKGKDGTTALPQTVFTYKPEVKNWAGTTPNWLEHADVDAHLEMSTVTMADMNGDGLTDIVRTFGNTWKVLVNQGSSWSTQYQTWATNIDVNLESAEARLMDVTGDSLPDIVTAGSANDWRVRRNTGTGFSSQTELWANLSNIHSEINLGNNRVRLADVTGDGLPEIIRTWWNGNQQYDVFRNTGNSWSQTKEVWSYNGIGQGLDDGNVGLLDANGDGLTDIVLTTHNGTNSWWKVYKNTGSSWDLSGEYWINGAAVDAYFGKSDVAVSDVDGDGLPDIVKSEDLGSADRWKVLRNTGNSWSTNWETWIDPSQGVDIDVHNSNTKLADVTGDGLPDIVKGTADCSCPYDTWKVWKNQGKAGNLLSSVKTSEGGIINFDYKTSTSLDNTGPDNISDLPFNMWLVEKKTENNGMSGAHLSVKETIYNYKDGLYKWQDKESRGFGEVEEFLPSGTKRKYVFHQDDVFKGLPVEVQVRDSQGNPYSESESSWGSSQSNGVNTIKLASEKNYTFDGSAVNPKITQADFQYDAYGNVTRKAELGDTGVSGDERFSYNEFVYNTSLWILNTVKHSYSRAADDSTKVAESLYFYDNHTGLEQSPVKGDVTREAKWVTGVNDPNIFYQYDNFGNLTQMTDANNHVSNYTYDSTGTYQTGMTNAKNQTSSVVYDLGSGNLLSKTDANGLAVNFEYDVFGRIVKEIKQYDSSQYPSTSYEYSFDGIAPEKTLVSKRETSGGPGVLQSAAYFDGLGRKVQTRREAENTSKQIVINTFYGANGEVWRESVEHEDNTSSFYAAPAAGVRENEILYDALDRLRVAKIPRVIAGIWFMIIGRLLRQMSEDR